ncbi:hypothetical protein ACFSKU_14425 [Pontibacter silvestris]|uniref:Uncharacterized protein n=1 Tax=Pontibacter silvestris TaxID=2305183 RepID=A0ABW4WZD0_9BACT|nr:hypothetical protein [Pontibacter silvestris]MCC9138253.1 hypothetical protein [Pontibacter silvestris]
MTGKPFIIPGSSRKENDTLKAVRSLFSNIDYVLADLLGSNINNYKGNYPEDDEFLNLISQMMDHSRIVLPPLCTGTQ